jgi:hypothetical protein
MQIRRHCHSWTASDVGTQPSSPLIYKAVWDPQPVRKTYQRKYFYPHRVLNPGSPVNQTSICYTDEKPALKLHSLPKRSRSYGWNDGFCFSSCIFATNRDVKAGKIFSTPHRNVLINSDFR